MCHQKQKVLYISTYTLHVFINVLKSRVICFLIILNTREHIRQRKYIVKVAYVYCVLFWKLWKHFGRNTRFYKFPSRKGDISPQEKCNFRTFDMLIVKNNAPKIVGKYEGFSLDLDFLKRLFALGFNVCDITSTKIRK